MTGAGVQSPSCGRLLAGRRQGGSTSTDVTFPRSPTGGRLQVCARGGCDEQWFDAVPSDLSATAPDCLCGGGPCREVQITADGRPASLAQPYPVVHSGGIVPNHDGRAYQRTAVRLVLPRRRRHGHPVLRRLRQLRPEGLRHPAPCADRHLPDGLRGPVVHGRHHAARATWPARAAWSPPRTEPRPRSTGAPPTPEPVARLSWSRPTAGSPATSSPVAASRRWFAGP
ncbi:peptide-N4-asparagine amidase [Streptomyces sp. NPDC057486]|uniref:peptide-N4-asparagine amidase n=1 Tax=Streptomyces sp. NPDC057486 TaxID=3346145 RepID=UPI0036B01700